MEGHPPAISFLQGLVETRLDVHGGPGFTYLSTCGAERNVTGIHYLAAAIEDGTTDVSTGVVVS